MSWRGKRRCSSTPAYGDGVALPGVLKDRAIMTRWWCLPGGQGDGVATTTMMCAPMPMGAMPGSNRGWALRPMRRYVDIYNDVSQYVLKEKGGV